jgi:hypothetical protein
MINRLHLFVCFISGFRVNGICIVAFHFLTVFHKKFVLFPVGSQLLQRCKCFCLLKEHCIITAMFYV